MTEKPSEILAREDVERRLETARPGSVGILALRYEAEALETALALYDENKELKERLDNAIEPRFKVGDEVWPVGWIPPGATGVRRQATIAGARVFIDAEGVFIQYEFEGSCITKIEVDCFPTEALAQAECDRRNQKDATEAKTK